MQKTVELFSKIFKKYFAPIPKIKVSEWADQHRIISTGNAFPGKWRTNVAPYQREIMDAFTEKGIQRVVVMSAAQIGKSDIMNNVIGRFAHLDPCPIMMVQPTDATAQDYSKSRISPMIRDTNVLQGLFRESKSRDTSNTILNKIFPGGRLIMTGSNSPSQLASRFIRILLCDEVDRFEASAGTEGNPIDLAEKRLTTFWNKICALFSTPTVKGFSRIEAEYLLGTQEEWQHRCPGCQEYHLLTHRHMIWDAEEAPLQEDGEIKRLVVVRDVRWVCPDCGMQFAEEILKVQPQKYVARNPGARENRVRSFFVNGFTPPWLSWKEIIKEYLEAKDDENKVKVVFNTRFAESFEQLRVVENVQVFVDGREDYGAELPDGVLMLTAAVDTQDTRIEYEICGWGENEECWGIEKGAVLGVPDQQSVWGKLDEVLGKTYLFADGGGLKVARTFIDSGGHYTQEVYRYCQKNYRRQRFAIKGSNNYSAALLERIAKTKNYSIPLIMLGVSQGKEYVFQRLLKEGDGNCLNGFHFPRDDRRGYTLTYFKQLCAEQLQRIKVKGRTVLAWVNIAADGRNEALDLRVYNLACIQSINPDWTKYKEPPRQETKSAPESGEDYGAVNAEGGWMDA
jgi:phage terminase large subunit GpA-like protein